jgi:GNAT superfamily N-acetyltransferase
MIREIYNSEFKTALLVINDAALAYRGVIPEDCWKQPYMSEDEFVEEVEQGVRFYGYFEDETLLGIMGIQRSKEVTLIRHAYVLTKCQRRGVGKELLKRLIEMAETEEILVGTWADAWWATGFYEKSGFKSLCGESFNMLKKYWNIPFRQAECSVVLKLIR